jgi:hypothetical protein
MKKLYKSKTMIFSFLLVIFGAIMDNFTQLQSVISEKYYGIIFVCIGIICAVLRLLTTGPVE